MRKNEFLRELRKQLGFLSRSEQEEILNYYDELIQDSSDHGENEKEFIASLGPIEDIVQNIKNDGSFFEKVRARVPFSVSEVFDVTVKVIGYFFFVVFAITILSISFSFFTSGIAVIFYSVIQIVTHYDQDMTVTLLRLSQMMVGAGILILGIAMFKWFFNAARTNLKQLLKKVQSLMK